MVRVVEEKAALLVIQHKRYNTTYHYTRAQSANGNRISRNPSAFLYCWGERKRPTERRSRGIHTNILKNQFSTNRTISNACSCVNS